MSITTYVQGEKPATDKALFGFVGAMLTDIAVHKRLGTAVTSRVGDLWHVTGNKKAKGFAVSRILATGKTAHVRYLYASGDAAAERELLSAVLDVLRQKGVLAAHTNDRKTSTVWKAHGFKLVETARRGEFVRWELDMRETQ